MTRSKPTITLIDYRNWAATPPMRPEPYQQFRVYTLNGSTNYVCGQWLSDNTVQEIIRSGWNVNLRGPKKGEL